MAVATLFKKALYFDSRLCVDEVTRLSLETARLTRVQERCRFLVSTVGKEVRHDFDTRQNATLYYCLALVELPEPAANKLHRF